MGSVVLGRGSRLLGSPVARDRAVQSRKRHEDVRGGARPRPGRGRRTRARQRSHDAPPRPIRVHRSGHAALASQSHERLPRFLRGRGIRSPVAREPGPRVGPRRADRDLPRPAPARARHLQLREQQLRAERARERLADRPLGRRAAPHPDSRFARAVGDAAAGKGNCRRRTRLDSGRPRALLRGSALRGDHRRALVARDAHDRSVRLVGVTGVRPRHRAGGVADGIRDLSLRHGLGSRRTGRGDDGRVQHAGCQTAGRAHGQRDADERRRLGAALGRATWAVLCPGGRSRP